jgi:hypothetical protein
MILLTAAIVLIALGFLTCRIWEDLRQEPARSVAYWLDAIEGGSPIRPKDRLS